MKKISMLFCAGVLMSALGAAFTACNNEPNETEDPETKGVDVSFTEYSLEEGVPGEEISARWVNLPDENNTLLVINSDEELKKYVEGDYPEIDLTKHTLLLAYGYKGTEIHSVSVEGLRKLSESKYKLNVELVMTFATRPDAWYVALITDKLNENSKVELNVSDGL
ncbi:MAG: hypothetical protein LBU80_02005 [Rikenellaceae bacterium]|jgi:hypothetical protein|nr:hypothetical protein [Rikenellaceae bacterium]